MGHIKTALLLIAGVPSLLDRSHYEAHRLASFRQKLPPPANELFQEEEQDPEEGKGGKKGGVLERIPPWLLTFFSVGFKFYAVNVERDESSEKLMTHIRSVSVDSGCPLGRTKAVVAETIEIIRNQSETRDHKVFVVYFFMPVPPTKEVLTELARYVLGARGGLLHRGMMRKLRGKNVEVYAEVDCCVRLQRAKERWCGIRHSHRRDTKEEVALLFGNRRIALTSASKVSEKLAPPLERIIRQYRARLTVIVRMYIAECNGESHNTDEMTKKMIERFEKRGFLNRNCIVHSSPIISVKDIKQLALEEMCKINFQM